MFPAEFFYFVISGFVLILLAVFAINFVMGGFLFTFLKVKASRGKKVMVELTSPITTFYCAAMITQGMLLFKDNMGKNRRVRMAKGGVRRGMTILWCSVDDETNAVILPSGDYVQTHDAVKTDNLLVQALTTPKGLQGKLLNIILVAVLVLGAVSLVTLFMTFSQGQQLEQLVQAGARGVGVV